MEQDVLSEADTENRRGNAYNSEQEDNYDNEYNLEEDSKQLTQ